MSDIRSVTYHGAYAVTESDTAADPKGPFSGLQATTAAGLAKVTCLDGSVATIYLPLGTTPIAVSRVWSSVTAATGIVGLKAPNVNGA